MTRREAGKAGMGNGRAQRDKCAVKLTLGTAQLGLNYGIHNLSGLPDEQQGMAILEAAWQAGVDSYDTAAAYGNAEQLLGRFFAAHPERRPRLITKLRFDRADFDAPRQIGEYMYGKVESSLLNLGLQCIPILLLHNADVMAENKRAVTDCLQRMIREGLIGEAGLSIASNRPQEVDLIRNFLDDDLYRAFQLPMNLFDHRPLNNGVFHRLVGRGSAIYVRSVFLQGLLMMQEREVPDGLAAAREPIARLARLAEKYGLNAAQAAVSFIRDLPGVHHLVIGVETMDQLEDNLRLLDGPPIAAELREEIGRQFAHMPEQVITPYLWTK